MQPALEGYVAAVLETLGADDLATAARDLRSVEETFMARADLHGVLTDTSISGPVRGQVVRELLSGKVGETTVRLAVYTAVCSPAQEVPHSLAEVAQAVHLFRDTGLLPLEGLALTAARRRVGGFADELLERLGTPVFATIEDELFRWARTVEASLGLRRLLLDRDAPLDARLGATTQLLAGKVDPSTLRLANFVIEGGRPRDVVGTLDFLVDYVARARDWRVARVHTARPLDAESQGELVGSLTSLTGHNVELQIAETPDLLGGVLVELGDLRLDATTRGRLDALADAVASGHLYETALNRHD